MPQQDLSKDTLKQIQNPDQCRLYGAFVRGARAFLGLNQDEFAKMVGVERTTLIRLEKGEPPLKRHLCQSVIQVLAQAGIKSSDILDVLDGLIINPVISIKIEYERLQAGLFGLSKTSSFEEKQDALLGLEYRPPLVDQPLRVNKYRGAKDFTK